MTVPTYLESETSGRRLAALPAPCECQGLPGIVGDSAAMRRVFDRVRRVAAARSTVLITGETGTGKELVVRAVHQLSPRKNGPLVALNCAAIPKDLAESELFGHARGAFTGATAGRVGKFAAADGGTLLIDEIGEMELPVQAKLLRALDSRSITPVGSNEEKWVDVRVVAATHRDLRALVREGKFREDLYYRLFVVHVELPPLRQRPDDVPLLADLFLRQFNQEYGTQVRGVSPEAMAVLQAYAWPGNVRQLRHLLEGIVVLSGNEVIDAEDLPEEICSDTARGVMALPRRGDTLSDVEREAIQKCLIANGGNRLRTARLLGISTPTLRRKIQEYALEDPRRATAGRARPRPAVAPAG